MGSPCLSLMAMAALIAASTVTHGSTEQVSRKVEEEPASSICGVCAIKIGEAWRRCGSSVSPECSRELAGLAKCCENCQKSLEKMNSGSSMEAEAEAAFPIWCILKCGVRITLALAKCAGSDDFGACMLKALGDCFKCWVNI